MPRYIDADVFEQRLEDKDIFFPALYKIELNSTPTADVVPNSEVDLYRKQVDELEDELASTYDKLENANTEVAREIITDLKNAGIDKWRYPVVAEIEKKYTKEKEQ